MKLLILTRVSNQRAGVYWERRVCVCVNQWNQHFLGLFVLLYSRFIYETERFNGVAELLEILGRWDLTQQSDKASEYIQKEFLTLVERQFSAILKNGNQLNLNIVRSEKIHFDKPGKCHKSLMGCVLPIRCNLNTFTHLYATEYVLRGHMTQFTYHTHFVWILGIHIHKILQIWSHTQLFLNHMKICNKAMVWTSI